MTETATNPIYQCKDCGAKFRSSPITVVKTPDLQLPPCPACQGSLTIGSILLSLMEDPPCDESIAKAITQNPSKAYREAVQREIDNLQINTKTTQELKTAKTMPSQHPRTPRANDREF